MGSSTALKELQRDLENKANDLRKLQKDIGKNHEVRKKYTVQLGENELVLKELELLKEDANVYKLIGPVLVKQDLAEANANVKKRIEYISAELKVVVNICDSAETSVGVLIRFAKALACHGSAASGAFNFACCCYPMNPTYYDAATVGGELALGKKHISGLYALERKRLDATLQDMEEKQNSKKEGNNFELSIIVLDTKNTATNPISPGWKSEGVAAFCSSMLECLYLVRWFKLTPIVFASLL
ncbi:Prefoldin subunit 6-like protein [Drosera capensis]